MGKRRNQNDDTTNVEHLIEESTPSKKKRIEENGASSKLANGTEQPKKRGRPKKNSTTDDKPVEKLVKKKEPAAKKKSTKSKKQIIEDKEEIEDQKAEEQPKIEEEKQIGEDEDIDVELDSNNADEGEQSTESKEEKVESPVKTKAIKKFDFEKFASLEIESPIDQPEEEIIEKVPVVKEIAPPKVKGSKKSTKEEKVKSPVKSPVKTKATRKPSTTKKPKVTEEESTEQPSTVKKSKVTEEESTEQPAPKKGRKSKQTDQSNDETEKVDNKKESAKKTKKVTKKQKVDQPSTSKPETIEEEVEKEKEIVQQSVISSSNEAEDKKMSKKKGKSELKIISFNVNGARAPSKKFLPQYLSEEDADMVCLQELKCTEDQMPKQLKEMEGYLYYCNSPKDKTGYAGVATFTKVEPLKVTYDFDSDDYEGEGREITCEFKNFYLVNVYATNAGRNGCPNLSKKRDWSEAFRKYLIKLDKKKPVIACGDFNCAHTEIDLENPKTNTKSAGFTPEEREDFTLLLDSGFFDSLRHLYPDQLKAYTFWSNFQNSRERNVGWRLDYFLLSDSLKKGLIDNEINKDVTGSDHCPITLYIKI